MSTTWSGCSRNSTPRRDYVPGPHRATPSEPTKSGVIYYGSTSPAMDEALDKFARGQGIHLDALRLRGFPFADEVVDFIAAPRPGVRGRAEPRRAVAHARRSTRATSIRRASSPCCTTTARRSPRASSSTRSRRSSIAANVTPSQKGGRAMTYIAKPKLHHPKLADQQARLHAARLRRRGLDALRRLRP